MFHTVTVTVSRPGEATKDRFGNAMPGSPETEEVSGVLVQGPASEDMEAARPDGAVTSLVLHFPKSYVTSLKGCTVGLPAPWDRDGGYRVIGDPLPLMDANVPGPWNRQVKVEVAHG